MTTMHLAGLVQVGTLVCLVAACAVEGAPSGAIPANELETGEASAAATQASFANDDLTAICNLTQSCCGPLGYTIDQTTCRNLFTSFQGFQGELDGSSVFNAGGVTYNNTSANTCLAGITAMGCGNIGAASYKATHLACMNVMTGTRAAGVACTNSVQCSPSNYCDTTAGACAPLRALGQACTSSDQCSYRAKGSGCDVYGTGTCVALLASGAACTSGAECQSGLCDGTCALSAPTPFDASNCSDFGGTPTPSATMISGGESHTCALLSGGAVKCWGYNGNGQIGDGTTAKRLNPVTVNLGGAATAVDAGPNHTCARMSTGAVKCWGSNEFGQLGDGTTISRRSPVSVVNLGGTATSVSVGAWHTCARMSNGSVKCWGRNFRGVLGNNNTADSATPVSVANLGGTASAISAGYNNTCALLSSGAMRCWGDNFNGALGDGTTTHRTSPVSVTGLGGTPTSIAAGGGHTCAALSSGAVKCWGDNTFGAIGDGTSLNIRLTPVSVIGLGGAATAVTVGYNHSCARLNSGVVRCWGRNDYGALGNNTTTDSLTPASVVGLVASQAFDAGALHTCAVLSTGALRCWGANSSGSLGDGTGINRLVPVPVYP